MQDSSPVVAAEQSRTDARAEADLKLIVDVLAALSAPTFPEMLAGLANLSPEPRHVGLRVVGKSVGEPGEHLRERGGRQRGQNINDQLQIGLGPGVGPGLFRSHNGTRILHGSSCSSLGCGAFLGSAGDHDPGRATFLHRHHFNSPVPAQDGTGPRIRARVGR